MLNTNRHKRAKCEGYQARVDNKQIADNPYSKLGKVGQVYASVWDSGWIKADENHTLNKGK